MNGWKQHTPGRSGLSFGECYNRRIEDITEDLYTGGYDEIESLSSNTMTYSRRQEYRAGEYI